MKFEKYLRTHLTLEWYSQYIAYDDMKELLTGVVSKASPIDETNDRLLRQVRQQ